MLSVIGTYPVTFTWGATAPMAAITPNTAAPPLMSHFMVIIPVPVLIDRPPESKVRPLPTSATDPWHSASGSGA